MAGWTDTGPRPTTIQPGGSSTRGQSYTRARPKRLFEVSLRADDLRLPGQSIGYNVAHGLFLSAGAAEGLPAGDGSAVADVRLTVGRPYGGAPVVREITLLPGGAWLSAAGWVTAKLEVLECLAPCQVSWAWTTQGPPTLDDLVLIRPVTAAAGTLEVPDGADRLELASPDPGWQWQTTIGTLGPFVVPQPQPGNGQETQVSGAFFTPSVDNVAVWRLRGL